MLPQDSPPSAPETERHEDSIFPASTQVPSTHWGNTYVHKHLYILGQHVSTQASVHTGGNT